VCALQVPPRWRRWPAFDLVTSIVSASATALGQLVRAFPPGGPRCRPRLRLHHPRRGLPPAPIPDHPAAARRGAWRGLRREGGRTTSMPAASGFGGPRHAQPASDGLPLPGPRPCL